MVLPFPSVIVYTSTTGGSRVREATTRVLALLKAYVPQARIQIVYMDIELTEKKRALRQQIWQETGKKGTWPLVYVNNAILGTVEELERLNERKQLNLAIKCMQAAI